MYWCALLRFGANEGNICVFLKTHCLTSRQDLVCDLVYLNSCLCLAFESFWKKGSAVMKETNSATDPIGQNLIKLISNVYFSVFVFSVLIITVIAITYQPADPCESSRALTKVFTQVENATYRTDTSVLKTGEDIADPPRSSQVETNVSITEDVIEKNEIDLKNVSLSSGCADGTAVNCSDPRLLITIERFNLKTFKSIAFLDYQTPVNGSKPNECDVAWRFRNKKEKSWRRYRDFRRFVIGFKDDCSYRVTRAGRWHSGVNARRPRIRPSMTRNGPRSKIAAAPAVRDEDINDTLPVLGLIGLGISKWKFDAPEAENYWYRVCEGPAANYIQRPWHALWKSKRLMNIVTAISGSMDWDFDAVHVVRGEKAQNKELWPNLDADTSPDALVAKLQTVVNPWRHLYVATNEPFYNYFDKLRSHYKVRLLEDYKEMWNNSSEWYNETSLLNRGHPVEFDGYMRVEVDTEVLYRAKTRVETFYNLTKDCKDGINTC